MRKLILGVTLVIFASIQASASDWRVMLEWTETAQKARSAFLSAGNSRGDLPPRFQTALRLAMFTAANAVEKDYVQYFEDIKVPAKADANLAASAAAGHILILAYGEPVKQIVMAQRDKYFMGASEDAIKASIAVGEAAASAALARAKETVADEFPHYKPQTTAGVYVTPYMPAFPRSFFDMKPWVLKSRDAVRAPNPPALDSDVWARDFNEVKELGGKHDSRRTPEQTAEALFWVGQGSDILIDQLAERHNWSLLEMARMYMMLSMSFDDGMLAVAESKYHHNFWRPITSIRRAELDGRDDTIVDAGWEPFRRTPNHPEYPCAHCVRGGVTAGLLEGEAELKNGETLKVYDSRKPQDTTTISSFQEFEQRMSMSRIYIGAHYRTSNEAGEHMGRVVVDKVRARFAPVAK